LIRVPISRGRAVESAWRWWDRISVSRELGFEVIEQREKWIAANRAPESSA
jgi:hypothetical protein